MVLNNIDCDGSETSILQCPSNGWKRVASGCDHSKDAGVFCYKYGECQYMQPQNVYKSKLT